MWRRFNEAIAVRITLAAFTMEAVYLCTLLSLLPVIQPKWMDTVLFISNAVQLTLLSVVGVGSAVLSRKQETRSDEDHEELKVMFADIQEDHTALREIVEDIREDHAALHQLVASKLAS